MVLVLKGFFKLRDEKNEMEVKSILTSYACFFLDLKQRLTLA